MSEAAANQVPLDNLHSSANRTGEEIYDRRLDQCTTALSKFGWLNMGLWPFGWLSAGLLFGGVWDGVEGGGEGGLEI